MGGLLVLVLMGCAGISATVTPTPISSPTSIILPTPTLATLVNIPTPIVTVLPPSPVVPTAVPADTGWVEINAGIERRIWQLHNPAGEKVDQLYLLRFNPTQVQFDVAYSPSQPKTLPQWATETGAFAVMNGGFFTPEHIATGRIVVDGVGSGITYDGQNTGMVAILPNGQLTVRWLPAQPYTPDEALQAGLQAFPMLVKPGGVVGYTTPSQDHARRTVVGVDNVGRVVWLVSSWRNFTLAELSQFLVDSDLDLEVALNLDGGTSSGIWLEDGTGVNSFGGMPAILAAFSNN